MQCVSVSAIGRQHRKRPCTSPSSRGHHSTAINCGSLQSRITRARECTCASTQACAEIAALSFQEMGSCEAKRQRLRHVHVQQPVRVYETASMQCAALAERALLSCPRLRYRCCRNRADHVVDRFRRASAACSWTTPATRQHTRRSPLLVEISIASVWVMSASS